MDADDSSSSSYVNANRTVLRGEGTRRMLSMVFKGILVAAGAAVLAEVFWRIFRAVVVWFNRRSQQRLHAGNPITLPHVPPTNGALFSEAVLASAPAIRAFRSSADVDRVLQSGVRLATLNEITQNDFVVGIATKDEIRDLNASLEAQGNLRLIVGRSTPLQGTISLANTDIANAIKDTTFWVFIYQDQCRYCMYAKPEILAFAQAHPNVPILTINDLELVGSNLSRIIMGVPMLYLHIAGSSTLNNVSVITKAAMESALNLTHHDAASSTV